MKLWKLFWDIGSVAVGLYCFWQVFSYLGKNVEGFGYFPIGIVAGAIVFGITVILAHLIEGVIGVILYKLFGIRVDKKLMFE